MRMNSFTFDQIERHIELRVLHLGVYSVFSRHIVVVVRMLMVGAHMVVMVPVGHGAGHGGHERGRVRMRRVSTMVMVVVSHVVSLGHVSHVFLVHSKPKVRHAENKKKYMFIVMWIYNVSCQWYDPRIVPEIHVISSDRNQD